MPDPLTWTLTGPALDRLLRLLDDDRERAGQRYEALRERLEGLIRWWGCPSSAELADRAFDRVAKKLEEGASVDRAALPAYVASVTAGVVFSGVTKQITLAPRAR